MSYTNYILNHGKWTWDDVPQPVVMPKPHCPTQYGIRTRAEVETEGLPMPSRLTEFAGRTTTKAMLDPFAKSWLLQFDDELVSVPSAWLSRTISHAWVDNGGMLKSFCKVCDCDAEWCRDTYQYVAKARTE